MYCNKNCVHVLSFSLSIFYIFQLKLIPETSNQLLLVLSGLVSAVSGDPSLNSSYLTQSFLAQYDVINGNMFCSCQPPTKLTPFPP